MGSDDRNILSVPNGRISSEMLGIRPPGSETFSLPGIRSDFIGWSDPTRSYRIRHRIESPGLISFYEMKKNYYILSTYIIYINRIHRFNEEKKQ